MHAQCVQSSVLPTSGTQATATNSYMHAETLSTWLQYVLHFPKGEKYVSIIKDATEPAAQAKLVAERARLRAVVARNLADAAMLGDADEGIGPRDAAAQNGVEYHASAEPGSKQAEQGKQQPRQQLKQQVSTAMHPMCARMQPLGTSARHGCMVLCGGSAANVGGRRAAF